MPRLTLAPGTRLGPYEILSALGAGGMGEVYRARDPRLDRQVAIKLLPGELAADPHSRERLRREAMAVAALDHPYICKIFEIGEDGDALFLVMEYIAGETLHRRLQDGPLPLSDVLRLAGEIAEALQEAHARRFLHRDLKPANIMLTEQGHVKVMDFGLAKRVEDLPSPDQATREIGASSTDCPRVHRRHPGLHVARAGERRHARCALRLVFLRRDSGRDDQRAASVPPAIDGGDALCGAPRTA